MAKTKPRHYYALKLIDKALVKHDGKAMKSPTSLTRNDVDKAKSLRDTRALLLSPPPERLSLDQMFKDRAASETPEPLELDEAGFLKDQAQ